jgi:transcriptional regulator with XRE-family HTH domain
MGTLQTAELIQNVDPENLGKRVRNARIAAGLRQRDLAGDEWTAAYVSRIESGQRRPSLQVLTTLAERMGVTAGMLLGASESTETWTVREEIVIIREWTIEASSASEAMRLRHVLEPDISTEDAIDISTVRSER